METAGTGKWWRYVCLSCWEISILRSMIYWNFEIWRPRNFETKEPKNCYFQVRESPAPLYNPIPTPAPDHPFWRHERTWGTRVVGTQMRDVEIFRFLENLNGHPLRQNRHVSPKSFKYYQEQKTLHEINKKLCFNEIPLKLPRDP